MIACPTCQTSNAAGAQFCGSCGTQLTNAVAGAQAGVERAGFGVRFVSALIDGLILLIPNVILALAVDAFAARLLLQIIITAAYDIGFWVGAEGATPGKMAMGLRVTMANGDPIDVGPAVLRYVGYFVSFPLTLGIGYLLIAFSDEKRGLHDQIAGTIVVKTR